MIIYSALKSVYNKNLQFSLDFNDFFHFLNADTFLI